MLVHVYIQLNAEFPTCSTNQRAPVLHSRTVYTIVGLAELAYSAESSLKGVLISQCRQSAPSPACSGYINKGLGVLLKPCKPFR